MHTHLTRSFMALFLMFAGLALFAEDSTITFGGASGWSPLSLSNAIARGKGQLGYEALVLDSSALSTSRSAEAAADSRDARERVGAFDSIYGGYGESPDPGTTPSPGTVAASFHDDLSLSFDGATASEDTGNYTVVSSKLLHVGPRKARRGAGAALCNTAGAGLTLRGKNGALFATPGNPGSFTIEFWLFPAVTENGSVLFQWRSSRRAAQGSVYQYVRSSIFQNHLEWKFSNVWFTAKGLPVEITLEGRKNLIPNQWSHHELIYDEGSGLIEYRVDGSTEDIAYATSSGHERGDVYGAAFGSPADVEIAPRFSGLIDEFTISRRAAADQTLSRNRVALGKFPRDGGRFETMPFDTGGNASTLKSLAAVANCPAETGVAFFVRAGDNCYAWTADEPAWVPVKSGEDLTGITGRYFQVAGELYADGRGAATPKVTSVTLRYERDTPAWPPARVFVAPGDGAVTLTWPASIDVDVKGYLVYYGEEPGEYLGDGSPQDAGAARSFTVTGLKNGRIYYFAIAAYDNSGPHCPGQLSTETYARPLASRHE